ncbi:MAG TPA: tetratricopeptide repeat protein [Phycisphaerae bacterium]|nr:tetratricopeptide repeat protein [Phycisphaerae bacterium]
MQTARRIVRNRIAAAAVLAALLAFTPTRAHAASKEIIALQTQVQQLMDMVQRLQSTVDSRFGVLQHLVEQTADQANQMTQTVNAMQQKLNTQSENAGGKLDAVSGQIQSLNDSIDELKSRMAKLDKSIQDVQGQLQNIQTPPQTAAPGGAPGTMPAGSPGTMQPAAQQAPPLEATMQAAERDFNAAKYDLAASEFNDVIHYYPMDDMAGTAQFYLGEIAYRQKNYDDAIKAYNAVLEGFSGNAKAPAAQLHKALSLLAQNKKDAGVSELRSLIRRHPQTPEADQARRKLNTMGVRIAGK